MTLLNRLHAAITGLMVTACLLLSGTAQAGNAAGQQNGQYLITGVALEQSAESFQLVISGKNTPTYTMYELFDPLRIILDMADARLDPAAVFPSSLSQGPVHSIRQVLLGEQTPPIVRMEITLADDRAYTVERKDSRIVVSFADSPGPVPRQPAQKSGKKTADSAKKTGPAPTARGAVLADIEVDTSNPQETLVFLKTDRPLAEVKKAHLGKSGTLPDRMYIDIPGASLPGKALQLSVGTALARVRAAQRHDAVRVVFDSGLSELFAYEMAGRADGLVVKISEPSPASPVLAGLLSGDSTAAAAQPAPGAPAAEVSPPAPGELILPNIPAGAARATVAKTPEKAPAKAATQVPKNAGKKSAAETPSDTLGFAGYEKQRITVDFFKIDLHNVFRLFGEISGQNIVVDEAVQGTLTLALNDVPWDFALDIIINLKDLQKEERFNTIVISPKAKQFVWPKAATDAIAFKTDREAISVEQRLETPVEIIEARRLIREAAAAERSNQHEKALALYEAAFANWPDNAQLASRLAALCLVRFGLNAKALHYARAALSLEPGNGTAALQAAIAAANMKKIDEAKRYFDRAINTGAPTSEALISYASFAEEYESYQGALALLAKHEALHGDTLDTLVSKARILDKAGKNEDAVKAYSAILLSGYEVPEDLRRFIEGRIAAAR